jgi:hypothetical protein
VHVHPDKSVVVWLKKSIRGQIIALHDERAIDHFFEHLRNIPDMHGPLEILIAVNI